MSVRARLTLMYGGLFLLSGAALMAIAYALLVNAGFVFTIPGGPSTNLTAPATRAAALPTTQTSAATIAHWRQVAQCMRQHGVHDFPNPRTSLPPGTPRFSQIDDREGVMFVIPVTIDQQSRVFTAASSRCQLSPDAQRTALQDAGRRTQVRQQLLLQSGIALAGMSLLSLALGWLMAGRVLRPLEAAHQAQRQFVANASHELRAPLTRQRALIQVALADPNADTASLRTAHERVLAAEQHLEQIIDALLALTRGQAGLQRPDQVDLGAIASQTMLAQESDLEAAGLEVRSNLAAAPIQGDPRLIESLVVNLVQNAIRHNIAGGWLEISTGTRQRQPFLSVENTGPVIEPDAIERLFEPFQRLGIPRTSHGGGHGLGLSIVRAIARAHGAEVAAEPRPEGGLVVEIVFPPRPDSRSRMAVLSRRLRHMSPGATFGE
jgi:signal transduction histidine kinase